MINYGKTTCPICGKTISLGGAAKTSHMRSHVRDGSVVEKQDQDGHLVFEPTNLKPKPKEKSSVGGGWGMHISRPAPIKGPVKPVKANITESTEVVLPLIHNLIKDHDFSSNVPVVIHCRTCGKGRKATVAGFDHRFLRISCCNMITLFPVRKIKKMGMAVS